MRTKVKICGIKTLEEIKYINETGIDFIGFVFAESKRKVSANQAKILSQALNDNIKTVGVFVDHCVEDINAIADEVGLDIIQVHKNYTAEMIAVINKPVWYELLCSVQIEVG